MLLPPDGYQAPVYGFDLNSSQFTSYAYENNELVFTVEQGTRFYLKLHLTANPRPTSENVYENGHLLQYSPYGTIYTGVDNMRVESVNQSHAGRYKISSSNIAGEGHITFRLKVKGTFCSYN